MTEVKIITQQVRLYQYLGIGLAALVLVAAFFIRFPNTVRSGTYNLFREGIKQKALWTTRDMDSITGEHFVVRYTDGNQEDASLVLDTAERFYGLVAENYGYMGKGKIPIIVYSSRTELNRNFGWESSESAMGVYWAGVIRVLSPNVWVTETDTRDYQEEFINSGPMAHEFTHLVVDYITSGNYTRWFTEGMAQYEEYKLTGFEFDSSEASLDQPLYRLDEMDANFDNLPNQALAYRQSYLAIKYIAEIYGEESLKNILKSLSQNNNIDKAIKIVLGIDAKEFERDYQQWAVAQN